MTENSSDLQVLDFKKICRTCLSEGEMQSLYEDCISEVCIVEKLMSCTFVQFSEKDGLPTKICLQCIKEVEQAYKFATKCEQADKLLRDQLFPPDQTETPESKKKKQYALKKKRNLPTETSIKQNSNEENFEKICKENYVSDQSDELYSHDIKVEVILNTNESDDLGYNENLTETKLQKNETQERNLIKLENLPEFDHSYSEKPVEKINKKKRPKKKEPPFECKKCFEQFPAYHLLTEHYKKAKHSKNENPKRPCSICSKLVNYRYLYLHMKTHSSLKNFCCEVCGKKFCDGANFRRHRRIHTGERPFKCEICNKLFTRSTGLKEHVCIHNGEMPFICNICGKRFARLAGFKEHLKRHEKSGEKEDQIMDCDICGQKYNSAGALKTHQLTHGEKNFICGHCGRGFITLERLKKHTKSHEEKKPFTCTICHKSYVSKLSLKGHMILHSGEKKFHCNFCEKSFSQLGHLNYHLRVHTGVKPYSCSICGKSFALNGNLTVHMRTHTGETPYHCPVCDKGFYDSSSMKKHLKGHGLADLSK